MLPFALLKMALKIFRNVQTTRLHRTYTTIQTFWEIILYLHSTNEHTTRESTPILSRFVIILRVHSRGIEFNINLRRSQQYEFLDNEPCAKFIISPGVKFLRYVFWNCYLSFLVPYREDRSKNTARRIISDN